MNKRPKCVFCGSEGDLTKSHIWPKWSESIIPSTAAQHELRIGSTQTFAQSVPGPELKLSIKNGSASKKKPKNTCVECNGKWMRNIEEAAQPVIHKLMLGREFVLCFDEQILLSSFLCLVSMRVEKSAHGVSAIPKSDSDFIVRSRVPPPNWWIALCRYQDADPLEFWVGFFGMQIGASPNPPAIGGEHCNSQVTTIVAGHLCAHIFSSTVWPEFDGYRAFKTTKIWPPVYPYIDTRSLPLIDNARLPWLHEAIARNSIPIDAA